MACVRVDITRTDHETCALFEGLPLSPLNEPCVRPAIPLFYHAIGRWTRPPWNVNMTARMNPDFRLNYHTDATAVAYIRSRCGNETLRAFRCLRPPAYRADLFRFCALLAEGGVYMDADMVPMLPLTQMYDPCATMSAGHDQPQGATPGTQMKILAAAPGHPVARCMVERITRHVAARHVPKSSLAVSGPALLSRCIAEHSAGVVFTHLDTRGAAWPFTGLRTRERLLAFERPNEARHWRDSDEDDYAKFHRDRAIYTTECEVPVVEALVPPTPDPRPTPDPTKTEARALPPTPIGRGAAGGFSKSAAEWQRLAQTTRKQAWNLMRQKYAKAQTQPRAQKKTLSLG